MAIDKVNTIDLIGIDNKTGDAMLTISDHLDWEDISTHLHVLQEKINTYLRFIESGEIYESYPKAKGKKIVIEIVGKYELSSEGKDFFEKAKPIIKEAGIDIQFNILKDPPVD